MNPTSPETAAPVHVAPREWMDPDFAYLLSAGVASEALEDKAPVRVALFLNGLAMGARKALIAHAMFPSHSGLN